MGIGYMPFIVAIVMAICIAGAIVVHRAIEAKERIEMIKRGFVPKGYERIEQANSAANQSATNQQAALPTGYYHAGSPEWGAGLPTTAIRERVKEQ